MNFANATFLWGLLALSIPIIVHLFNFRKAKLVKFSNVRFLNTVKKKSSSKLQLKHLLILLCRLAFIFFLVLAFAQPFIPGQEEGLNENSVILYLDNSGSMGNLTDENTSALTVAQSIAQQVIDLYPSSTSFKILDNNFSPSANHFKSAEQTRDLLSEMKPSSVSRSGTEIFNKIKTLSDPNDHSEIFVLSDMQRSTFGQIDQVTDTLNQYYLIPLTVAQENNIYVDTAYINQPFILAHKQNILSTKIKNNGDKAIEDLIVKLHVNNQQSASMAVSIDSRSSKTISFELGKNLNKYNQARIEFQDFPVTFDNEFYLAFNLAPKIQVIEIKDQVASTYIEKVFEDNDLFEFNTFHTGDVSYQKLENSDVLVLYSVKEINSSLQAQIKTLLEAGKTVVLFPHAENALADLQSSLNLRYDMIPYVEKIEMEKPELNNPFFEGMFESIDNKTKLPSASPLFQLKSFHQTLLKTKTGNSFLSKVSQQGNLYIYGTALTDELTDFQRHAFFVPVMQRIGELSASSSNRLYYTADNDNMVVSLDSIHNNTLYKIKHTVLGEELIPSQRMMQNQLVMDFPKYLLTPGNYQLYSDQEDLDYIGFNHSKAESDLTIIKHDELSQLLSGIQSLETFDHVDSKNFTKILKEKYHSMELWKYALLLSLAFLIAESLLLRFL
ncbi:BatA domain-containing protein [Reichenbachiella agarivorans]|uniref:BatA domain-containing protein n=1 Tax=Reichenbachiella agarivorans TaxID=2979464 RepID=A0ABY6CX38_9BACT|nr:BatA domain-containing protein [Reichenbachiella agarivorans]UXP34013.1 BatA domain-containing protein [Reichenbachiella agarivorans]